MNSNEASAGGAQDNTVLVITVSYKTAALVINSLRALMQERARHTNLQIRAFVADNASGDTPALREAIAREGWGDWVTLYESDQNGGFSFGNNLGFRHAYESMSPPDYILLLNPDAEVRAGAIENLVNFLREHPQAAVAGSQLLNEDESPWPYAFRFPTIWSEIDEGISWGVVSKLLSRWVVAREMGNEPEQVDWLPGAAMMIRRRALDDVGGLDEAYFLYFEELDFFLKLRRHGWETWYVPSSLVMHIAGASSGLTGQRQKGPLPDYWFESRRRYFAKNFGVRYAMATDVAALTAHLLGRVKGALLGRGSHATPGYVAGFLRNSVLHKRNQRVAPAIEFQPPSPNYGKR